MRGSLSKLARLGVVAVATLGLVAAACSSDEESGGAAVDGPPIVIGAQDFGESAILAEIYSQALTAAGYTSSIQTLGGFRDISMGAFESGDINFAPEYVASLLEFLNEQAGEATGNVNESLAFLETALEPLGLEALEPAPGVDTNAFVVTAQTAETLGLESLSDLAAVAGDLTLGGPADCATNPFCIPGLQQTYDADLSAGFVGLDAGVVATALANGEIDVAVLFSTDGRIASENWVLLADDRNMLAAELIDVYGQDMADVVNAVSAKLTTPVLIELNRQYDVDKRDAREIASAWLAANPVS